MRFRVLIFCAALPIAAIFCGCRPAFDYVKLTGSGEYSAERTFLESFFREGGQAEALGLRLLPEDAAGRPQAGPPEKAEPGRKLPRPSLSIEFLSSWGSEAAYGDILVSKTALVPRDDVLAGRTNTSMEACIEGRETLIQPEELSPPFVALRVEGRALGDKDYPLIRAVGIRIAASEDKKNDRRLKEKIELLGKALDAIPKPLVTVPPRPFWIVSGGDVMLGRGAQEILLREGPKGIFGGTAEMLASPALALVNLEGVISGKGAKTEKAYNFRFSPKAAPALRNAGIDAVLLANNHAWDYGKEAFLDCLSLLSGVGIGVAGAGIDDEAASQPLVFKQGEQTCRVFGLASYPREQSGWDGTSAAAGPGRAGILHTGSGGAEKIKAKLSPNDTASLNLVLLHGGTEWSTRPGFSTRELCASLIAAGADIIIGSHPHVVQGFEWVQGKPVFWSLGNYVFAGMEDTGEGDEGLFVRLGFWNHRLLYLEPFALTLTRARTDIAPPEKLEKFYARSRELRERYP